MREFWLFAHLCAVVVWVGGMAFVQFCLRPAALALPPPQRLALMSEALRRFLAQVTAALAVLWASGIAMLLPVGLRAAPPAWHSMLGAALVMTGVFAAIRLVRYPALRAAVAASDWPAAGAALASIRALVMLNLFLGTLTIAAATLGRLL